MEIIKILAMKTPQALTDNTLIINTTDVGCIKIDFGTECYKGLASDLYCKNLKITIEEITDEEIISDAKKKGNYTG